jgi:hypothetical protein
MPGCVVLIVDKVGWLNSYILKPIGIIRSTLKGREDAPRQGAEGAPDGRIAPWT